jgi:hypothetical protein
VKTRRYRDPGRKRIDDRTVLSGILFVLTTGIAWQRLPRELGFGSGTTCWRRFGAAVSEVQQAAKEDIAAGTQPGQTPDSSFPRKRAELEIALSTLSHFGGPELPRCAELASPRELFPSTSKVLALVQEGHRGSTSVEQRIGVLARSRGSNSWAAER